MKGDPEQEAFDESVRHTRLRCMRMGCGWIEADPFSPLGLGDRCPDCRHRSLTEVDAVVGPLGRIDWRPQR